MNATQKRNQKLAYSAAFAAVAFSLCFVAAKAWVWLLGGSAALLSSLIDSAVDAMVSFSNFVALRYAFMPADDDHRYGHGKAEGVAALGQAAFIAGSSVFLLLEVIARLRDPQPVTHGALAIAVLFIGTLATLALTTYQRWVARQTKSLAVEADGSHYTSDVAVNIGVMASLLVGQMRGWQWLDPLVALLVGLWLLYCARGIALKAMDMLLDREVVDHVRLSVKQAILETPGVESMHDLRTRRSGPSLLVSFDIEVAPDLSLKDAHEIARQVEDRILGIVGDEFPHTEVMIHIDPRGDTSDSRHKRLQAFHAR
jgi:ferrous-iron efflux pump FieF